MDAEKLKQKILDLAIRGKLVPQDPNDEPASVLIEKIKAERVKLVKEGKIKASKEESYIFKGSDNFYYENGVSKIEFNPNLDCSNFIVWIKGSDIIYPMQTTKPNGYSFDYIDIDAIDNKNQKISQPKTLLVKDAPSRASRKVFPNSTIFSLVRPYLRNIALVGKKYENCIASTGFYVLTPLPFIDEQYLFLLLTSDYIVNSLNYYMKGDNSPSITTTVIENFYFPIPPISYQKRIVRLFDLINPLIEQIKNSSGQIRTYCKAIKNKVLDLYFGENSSYKSYYKNGSLIDDIEIYDNLRKPISLNEREKRVEKARTLYPYFGATGQTGVIDDFILEGEYVLLGEDGAPFLDKTADKAYLVQGKIWVNNHAHVLRSRTNNKFLMYYLNWFDYFDFVSGTTRLKLNQAMMKKIPFPIVSEDIKKKIVDKIERAFAILNVIN